MTTMWNVTCRSFSLLVGGHRGSKMNEAFWLQFLLQVEIPGFILVPCWVSWRSIWLQVDGLEGHFGSKLGGRGPPWLQFEGIWGHVGFRLRVLGAPWIAVGQSEAPLGSKLEVLAPFRLQVGGSWLSVGGSGGPSWFQNRQRWGLRGILAPSWAVLGSCWLPNWGSWDNLTT